jgi:hypothetical protein
LQDIICQTEADVGASDEGGLAIEADTLGERLRREGELPNEEIKHTAHFGGWARRERKWK